MPCDLLNQTDAPHFFALLSSDEIHGTNTFLDQVQFYFECIKLIKYYFETLRAGIKLNERIVSFIINVTLTLN